MNSLFIPFDAQQAIHATHFWVNCMYIFGCPYDAELITAELAAEWDEKRRIEEEAPKPSNIVKAPEIFKKDTSWKSWKESLHTYSNSQIWQLLIPLSYIIRENDMSTEELVYAKIQNELVHCTILYGPKFHINKRLVYDFLQSLTLNGPAWPCINTFQCSRNGRATWKALIAYYKGDAMKTTSKQDSYQMIAIANGQGSRRNYDFNMYVSMHQQAHQELERLREPIPENKKIRDFLSGILDPLYASIKLTVLSSNVITNNFLQTANYIAGAIDMMPKNSNVPFHEMSQMTSNSLQA
jgi:hypothetical protein